VFWGKEQWSRKKKPWFPELFNLQEATGGFEPPNDGFADPYALLTHPYSAFRQSRLRVCCENWRFG
jgi:hypothetical protein